MRKILFVLCFCLVGLISHAQEQVYELRTYELNFFKSADLLHNYLKDALLPALNRQGCESIGVFEEYGKTLPAKIYVVIPFTSINAFQASRIKLEQDEQYQKDGEAYLKAGKEEMPFLKVETSLLQSTYGFPTLKKPGEDAAFYELRIYRSHNEAALQNKVRMFDEYEFPIFDDAGLPMVFFGVNISGGEMPCLTYMLASKSMEENAANWGKFIQHPEWKRISAMEEFKGNMNDILRVYLKPLDYSQL
jgi:hypothetical protein